ncbi:hypothetical protein [Dankookia sp. P2]|uniref:hypothetical protein n=1 Tax=Dankookia sp. P2 TaxID=3423955 RepID=UPI003D6797D9
MVGGGAGVPKPDAGLGLDLLQVAAAIGGKQKGQAEGGLLAGAVGRPGTAGWDLDPDVLDEPLGVAPSLAECSGDVLVAPLRLDDADAGETDEKRVVGWPARGRPLGDGEVAAFGGASTGCVPHRLRVGIPAAGTKLGVDPLPRCGLVDVEVLGGGDC